MSILERKRELGMLMSVGMKKSRVFSMVLWETIFIASVGAPLGILAAHLCVVYYGNVGIDLSMVAEGMQSFGMGSTLYPAIEASQYDEVVVMVIITSFLAAIYPARKALKLKPAEAVRAL
ncbi:MAG: FtsX-like permease family protein [Flavobacteriales bacterium]|nr:FtsX-like permease family protein [Flavobacteriales bacterium]